MDREGESIHISFQPVTPNTIQVQTEQVEAGLVNPSAPKEEENPMFGPRPGTKSAEFDFETEI